MLSGAPPRTAKDIGTTAEREYSSLRNQAILGGIGISITMGLGIINILASGDSETPMNSQYLAVALALVVNPYFGRKLTS